MVESPATYGKASDLGLDSDKGQWVALCKRHQTPLYVPSRDKARVAAKNPATFCEDCRDVDQDAGEAQIVTFSATQTEPVTPEAFEDMNERLTKAHDEWLAEERAKQQPKESDVFYSGDLAHRAVSIEGTDGMAVRYMRTVCKPDALMMMGVATDESNEDFCPMCKAGVQEPEAKPARRGRWSTQPKVKPEPAPEPEPKFATLTDSLAAACVKLLTALSDEPSVPDARAALASLEPTLNRLKGMVPRRRVGVTTGARSGLVKQSATVNPSEELEQVKHYAGLGDKRAQDILVHVAAYQPDVDCSYCLSRGRSTRHGYATAFMSVGRELRAMEQRATLRNGTS